MSRRPYVPTHTREAISLAEYPLRVGSKLGRTLHAVTGEGGERDVFVAVADTSEIAEQIVAAVNIYYGHRPEGRW